MVYSRDMKVIATIQSKEHDESGMLVNDPVEIPYYTGDDLAEAMGAMAQAMVGSDKDGLWTRTLSIRVDF